MQKPHLLLTVLLGITLVFHSCTKEEIKPENEVGVSEYIDEYEGQFKKEFTVSDKNGNIAFYIAYSKDEEMLKDFVNNTKFTLTTDNVDIEDMKNVDNANAIFNNEGKSTSAEENGITIELITTNLKKGIAGFCLDVKEKSISDKIARTIRKTFTTTGGFIAIKNIGSTSFYTKRGWIAQFIQPWNWTNFEILSLNGELIVTDPLDRMYKIGIGIQYYSNDYLNYSI